MQALAIQIMLAYSLGTIKDFENFIFKVFFFFPNRLFMVEGRGAYKRFF